MENSYEMKPFSPLLQYNNKAIPVQPWEVFAESIDTQLEKSNSKQPHTWVAGFVYIRQEELNTRLYHKYILEEGPYSLNPSQYRQTFPYQKAGQRSRRTTDWYIPKHKRTQHSRPLWRQNSCWLPYKNWI